MKVLLDTNLVIHREAATVVNPDIGVLFRWLDNLHIEKCVHPVTVEELEKHQDHNVRKAFAAKLRNYTLLKTVAPLSEEVQQLTKQMDITDNDRNDTLIVNELYCGRVEALITEDKKLHDKCSFLGITDRIFTIDAFLEKVTAENPELVDYKILSVKKDFLGNLDLLDDFFTSFKEDYKDFEKWFNRKANETVYVCYSEGKLVALLFLKVEGEGENYSDIIPSFTKKKRLKICSFKVTSNGFRLGERFLKIVFDNALLFQVDEIYVTIFDKRIGQKRLINLFEKFGFNFHGHKQSSSGDELVYLRTFAREANRTLPKLTYPFFSTKGNIFIVSIYAKYHTELFPDSILNTESPDNFIENEPHRNAISKVFISRSFERYLKSGDVIIFYRTGGYPAYYKSVVSTIGIVESVIDNITSEESFIRLCRKRSVFTDKQLAEQWNYNKRYRPFIVNFLYAYSFPKRINLKRLIELGVISSTADAPRGFVRISKKNLIDILKECKANDSVVVY